ncbi:hypothetical protein QE152_g34949 [Popillia japonica]|uniref:Uncharacterized protein n=1 Tax=Popillia japonica TaxID=7064 RepID=A0AAW1IS84_POPJA
MFYYLAIKLWHWEMETHTKRKSIHPSTNQKMMTMEFLKKNPQLISGKFSICLVLKKLGRIGEKYRDINGWSPRSKRICCNSGFYTKRS